MDMHSLSMNKNARKKMYSQLPSSSNLENHASKHPNLTGFWDRQHLSHPLGCIPKCCWTGTAGAHEIIEEVAVHLALVPVCSLAAGYSQLLHLLCTSDGRSVKHHTWMICGEAKMSHGLDAKQLPVGRVDKLLPVVGWHQNSSILCSHQLRDVDLGHWSAFSHHLLRVLQARHIICKPKTSLQKDKTPDLVYFEVQCLQRSAHLKIIIIFVIFMTSF